jgi:phosphotransferase system HPr-like phosphotransfer protein
LRVCLINKDFRRDAHVTIDSGRSFVASSVMRLEGLGLDANTGITLGGASVDEFGACAPAMRRSGAFV